MCLTLSLSYVTGAVIVGRFDLYGKVEKKWKILTFFFFFFFLVMAIKLLLTQAASLNSVGLLSDVWLFRHFISELFQNHRSLHCQNTEKW